MEKSGIDLNGFVERLISEKDSEKYLDKEELSKRFYFLNEDNLMNYTIKEYSLCIDQTHDKFKERYSEGSLNQPKLL